MPHEIEIKLRIADVDALRGKLARLGARPALRGIGRVHEWNVVFDTTDGDLKKRGQLLRLRTETLPRGKRSPAGGGSRIRAILTFKRPIRGNATAGTQRRTARRHKIREEIELPVSDPAEVTKILGCLGLRVMFQYEKFRTTFCLPPSKTWAKGLLIELDETPIGTFVELEGPPQAIDRVAAALGFAKKDYITTNYLVLYRDDRSRRGKKPGDMTFRDTSVLKNWR
ncbi:MAG TPA: class IV adenylate cyclase [Candidatus Acidoferrum sp.]|jgi:adenylate cyclase class 2